MGLNPLTNRIYFLEHDSEVDRPMLAYLKGDKFSLAVDAGYSASHVRDFYRAALMAEQFYENQIGNTCNALNIHIAGLILIGSLLDRDKSLFPVERAVTNFSSIAAAHWYNMKGEKPLLKKYIEDAEEFAFRKYLTVLALGKKATEKERKERDFGEKVCENRNLS